MNIYDLFKLKSINSNLNSIVNDFDVYKKYLQLRRKDLITFEEKEEVISFNKKLKQLKSPLNNLYKINLRNFFF